MKLCVERCTGRLSAVVRSEASSATFAHMRAQTIPLLSIGACVVACAGSTVHTPAVVPEKAAVPEWTPEERTSFVDSCSEGIVRSLAKKEQRASSATVEATCVCTQEGAEERYPVAGELDADQLGDVGAECGNAHLAKRIYNAWPPNLKEAFQAQCGGPEAAPRMQNLCACALGKLEHDFTLLEVEGGKMTANDAARARNACLAEMEKVGALSSGQSAQNSPAASKDAPEEAPSSGDAEEAPSKVDAAEPPSSE